MNYPVHILKKQVLFKISRNELQKYRISSQTKIILQNCQNKNGSCLFR